MGKVDNNQSRVQYLDGFRGLAILLVLIYHSYARWADYYSFGHEFANNPFFNFDRAGVWLFFVISGFVITMSLERCKNFSQFIFKRWLRLFPAMLVASVLIFSLNRIFPLRLDGTPSFSDLIGGLSFISPNILNNYFGLHLRDLEGGFWSLYNEVFFYLIFGTLYFSMPKKYAIIIIAILSYIGNILLQYSQNPVVYEVLEIYIIAGIHNYYLFLTGILLYEYFSTRNNRYFILSIIALMFAAQRLDSGVVATTLSIGLLIIAVRVEFVQKIFNTRLFQFLGAISYPLYLLHENFIVTATKMLGVNFPAIPHILLPLAPIFCVIIIASMIEKTEKPIKNFIEKNTKNLMQNFKVKLQKV